MIFNNIRKSTAFAGGLMLCVSSLNGMQPVNPEENVRFVGTAEMTESIDTTVNNVQSELQRHKHSDFVRVLLIGVTGSGKSTLLHALAGANLFVERIEKLEDGMLIHKTVITSDGSKEMGSVKIGHTADSETGIPNLWSDIENKITYCDSPGFLDNKSYQQRILNAFSIDQLFSEPCAIKILLVISAPEFRAVKGGTAIRSFVESAKLLKTREEFMQSVGLVITKMGIEDDPRELLGELLTGTNEKVMEVRPLASFFLQNVESRVFTFPKQSLAKGVKKQPYGLFEDRARMIAFFKTNPIMNPPHSVVLDESTRGMLLSINGLKHTDMQIHLKELSDNIEKMYIDERDVDSIQGWIKVLRQLKDATSRGIGDFAGVLRSMPQFSGKFGAFLQQVDLFLPWQSFIKNFFDDETCLNVSEILDQKFDSQIQYLKGTKSREELRLENDRITRALNEARDREMEFNMKLAEKQQKIDEYIRNHGEQASEPGFWDNVKSIVEGVAVLAGFSIGAYNLHKVYKERGMEGVKSVLDGFANLPPEPATPNFGGWHGGRASAFSKRDPSTFPTIRKPH